MRSHRGVSGSHTLSLSLSHGLRLDESVCSSIHPSALYMPVCGIAISLSWLTMSDARRECQWTPNGLAVDLLRLSRYCRGWPCDITTDQSQAIGTLLRSTVT